MSGIRAFLFRNSVVFAASAVAAFVCCASGQANDQKPSENAPEPSLRIESNLVPVRVVVRDAHGQPVRGLKKEDFKLFDQGKQQSIVQFEEESPEKVPAAPAANPGQAITTAAMDTPRRYIAFYFDNLSASAADLMQARDAAGQYFATSLRPNDRVAIFTPEALLSDFTADAKQLHEALTQLHPSARLQAKTDSCPEISGYQALELLHSNDPDSDAWRAAWGESKRCAVRSFATSQDANAPSPDANSMAAIRMLAQRVVERSETIARTNLEQLDRVVQLTARAPGERTVVVISPGFLSESEQHSLDRIVDHALRSQVTISSLDPKGLAILMHDAGVSRSAGSTADPRANQAARNVEAAREFAGGDVLAELAQGTGGEFFHNGNDLTNGFARLTETPPYYVLAFAPKDVKRDGRFHSVKVTLAEKHRGYDLEARRGYFAGPANATPELAVEQASGEHELVSASADAGKHEAPGVDVKSSNALSEARDLAPPASAGGDLPRRGKGVNRVTVAQLEEILSQDHARPDAEVASRISQLELMERLSSARLHELANSLPGDQSRQELIAQADASAFLPLPAAEIPAAPPPDPGTQSEWLRSAVSYAGRILTKLPNFFATRDVTLFADSPAHQESSVFFPYQPLHSVDRSTATVLYRDGKEVIDTNAPGGKKPSAAPGGLITSGEFGPILATVLADAAKSSLTWSHWEESASGRVAVYRYAVPKEQSHYDVRFCCVPEGDGMGLYRQRSAYHGEITVDPANGAILRVTLQASLNPSFPMEKADIAVEYGPVEIGGRTYICPLKGIAIARAHVQQHTDTERPQFRGMLSEEGNANALPLQVLMNDIAFGEYHVFRSEARILPSDAPAQNER